ncbi:hypothetical protein HAX54_012052 [Datura stramonium]|uniref:Uncharacterized protein n=1 Tax=Datura stramonium TaxID=4076 RepID=A0ABS8Y3V6_DATST|nr:hypothetical protein [Datura stramonium]
MRPPAVRQGRDNTLAEDRAILVASLMSREAHVPILAGIDMELYATKKYDLEKSNDKSRYDLRLYKLILEVFRSSGQTARTTETTDPPGEATRAELFFHVAPIPTSTPSAYEEDMRARVGGASSSLAPQVKDHVIEATVSSESQTLITPPPATEAAPPDPLSVKVAINDTAEFPGDTPPQTLVQDSRA